MPRKPRSISIDSRLTAVERGIGSLRASDTTILNELRDGFALVESRLNQIYNHIDGFIKLHETLDNEFGSSASREGDPPPRHRVRRVLQMISLIASTTQRLALNCD
jgi:hypothetical protein